ncbi:hypothetical protein Droror1_Dr00021700 [Drosera rotundifolia]
MCLGEAKELGSSNRHLWDQTDGWLVGASGLLLLGANVVSILRGFGFVGALGLLRLELTFERTGAHLGKQFKTWSWGSCPVLGHKYFKVQQRQGTTLEAETIWWWKPKVSRSSWCKSPFLHIKLDCCTAMNMGWLRLWRLGLLVGNKQGP